MKPYAGKKKIRLVLADVDGTLVTKDKVLTERAQKAVHALHEKDILFAITSGRPPLGMKMLIEPLKLTTPVAGFQRRGVHAAGPEDGDLLAAAGAGRGRGNAEAAGEKRAGGVALHGQGTGSCRTRRGRTWTGRRGR